MHTAEQRQRRRRRRRHRDQRQQQRATDGQHHRRPTPGSRSLLSSRPTATPTTRRRATWSAVHPVIPSSFAVLPRTCLHSLTSGRELQWQSGTSNALTGSCNTSGRGRQRSTTAVGQGHQSLHGPATSHAHQPARRRLPYSGTHGQPGREQSEEHYDANTIVSAPVALKHVRGLRVNTMIHAVNTYSSESQHYSSEDVQNS